MREKGPPHDERRTAPDLPAADGTRYHWNCRCDVREAFLRPGRPLTPPRAEGSTAAALALLVLGALAGVALRFAPTSWIEQGFASEIYPLLTRLIVPVSSRSPLPVTLTVAGAAVVALAIAVALALVRGRGGRRLLLALSVALLLGLTCFNLGWGLNYAREPAERLLGLPAEPDAGSAAVAMELLEVLAATVTANAGAAPDSEVAIAAISRRMKELVTEIGGGSATLPGRARRLPPGMLLANGFAGVVSPFSLEVHIDGGLPPAAYTATAAHELAHIAGFAREADAELIGALAGLAADAPFARYAVALGQWARLTRPLDPEAQAAALASLPQRARDDLAAAREASERHLRSGPARTFGWLYDRFLRSQGIVAGIGDYDRSADLLLRAYLGGWVGNAPGPE